MPCVCSRWLCFGFNWHRTTQVKTCGWLKKTAPPHSGTGAFCWAFYGFLYFAYDIYVWILCYAVSLSQISQNSQLLLGWWVRCSHFHSFSVIILASHWFAIAIRFCMRRKISRETSFLGARVPVPFQASFIWLKEPTWHLHPPPPPQVSPHLQMTPTKVPTFAPISVGVICPPSYERTRELSSNTMTLDYSIVRENAPHNGTMYMLMPLSW